MSRVLSATGDQLASALHLLGVHFLMGGTNIEESFHQKPAALIAALAESPEARLRLSLIPLFLEHPEFGAHVRSAVQILEGTARLTLQCYYSAAVFLQEKYRSRLNALIGEKSSLPNLFSDELKLKAIGGPDDKLSLLAQRHQALSGEQVNWLGTYQHAAQVWLKGLEIQHS